MLEIKDEAIKEDKTEHFWPDTHPQRDVEVVWCSNKKFDASAVLFLGFLLLLVPGQVSSLFPKGGD